MSNRNEKGPDNGTPTNVLRMSATKSRAKSGSAAKPSGISEALWACLLDDYLSEEEDNEFSKIVGVNSMRSRSAWFLPSLGQASRRRASRNIDPRDVRVRGGPDDDEQPETAFGTGEKDVDERSRVDDAEMPPLTWLSVPSSDMDDGKKSIRSRRNGTDEWKRSRKSRSYRSLEKHNLTREPSRHSNRSKSRSKSRSRHRRRSSPVDTEASMKSRPPSGSRSASLVNKHRSRRQSDDWDFEERQPDATFRDARRGHRVGKDERSRRSVSSGRKKRGKSQPMLQPQHHSDRSSKDLHSRVRSYRGHGGVSRRMNSVAMDS